MFKYSTIIQWCVEIFKDYTLVEWKYLNVTQWYVEIFKDYTMVCWNIQILHSVMFFKKSNITLWCVGIFKYYTVLKNSNIKKVALFCRQSD